MSHAGGRRPYPRLSRAWALSASPPLPPRPGSPQFAYLKDSFCPSPEERVGVLYTAFGQEGRLVVSYALTPAWG